MIQIPRFDTSPTWKSADIEKGTNTMNAPELTRFALCCIFASSLASCGGGGNAPAPGAPLLDASQRSGTALTREGTVSSMASSTTTALPPLATTSDQTFGLPCSP